MCISHVSGQPLVTTLQDAQHISNDSASSQARGLDTNKILNVAATAHLAHKLGVWTPQNYSEDLQKNPI
jgi:hypothetical protein